MTMWKQYTLKHQDSKNNIQKLHTWDSTKMKVFELHNQPVEADTYEASMALNQLLKIGKHAIKIHNMIDDSAEMEAWVAKKIDLAGDYVKKVHTFFT